LVINWLGFTTREIPQGKFFKRRELLPAFSLSSSAKPFVFICSEMAQGMLLQVPDEVARIGALSNGSNGQRSLESASLQFEALWRRLSRQPKS
jgi:hypothetical protein